MWGGPRACRPSCFIGISVLPIVSIVVKRRLPFRTLNIDLVKPKKGTTMETIGKDHSEAGASRISC